MDEVHTTIDEPNRERERVSLFDTVIVSTYNKS